MHPRGDINFDGLVDSADVILLQRHLRGDVSLSLSRHAKHQADVAPVVGGASSPDEMQTVADLVVLMRLARGDLGAAQPTMNTITDTGNPLAVVDGSATAGTTVHLFVSDGEGRTVLIDSQIATSGTYSFSDVPKLFNGTNEYFVVVEDGSGLPSSRSAPQTFTHTYANPSPLPATLGAGIHVWTAEPSGNALAVDASGLSIPTGATLILGPGVKLAFSSGTALDLDGTLIAYGTASSQVTLTGANGGTWDGVSLVDPTVASIDSFLSRTRIDSIDSGHNAIRVKSLNSSNPAGKITVRDSEIIVGSGASAVLAETFPAEVHIEWSSLTGAGATSDTGVKLSGTSSTLISYSVVSGFDDCIDGVGGFHVVEYTEVANCTIGMKVENIKGRFYPGNKIRDNNTGIQLEPSTVGGVQNRFPSAAPYPIVRDSTFENNNIHIRSTIQPGWILPVQDADLLTSPRVVMDASRNYWGTTDVAIIESKIIDVVDNLGNPGPDGNLNNPKGALVDFTPYRESPNGPLELDLVSGHIDNDFDPTTPGPLNRVAIGPMLLAEGRSATIPAGTTVEAFVSQSISTRLDILIRGDLDVAGTGLAKVTFIAPDPDGAGPEPDPGAWWGLRFSDTATATLDHVILQHAHESIYALGADIAVSNGQISHFSKGGIAFESIMPSSSITNTTIDGLLDAVAQTTIRDTALRHVPGIQIIDSYPDCPAIGTCGSISNNVITNLVTGIHVAGGQGEVPIGPDPIIDGSNTITDNIWGIWLQGDRVNAAHDPIPSIRGNTIRDNSGGTPVPSEEPDTQFRFCVNDNTDAGANLCLSDYAATGTSTVVDAKENYWGITGPVDAIRAYVRIAEGERVAVDLSEYTDSGGTIVGGSDVLSANLVDIAFKGDPGILSGPVIRPAGSPVIDLDIEFYLHRTADVDIRVYPEDDTSGTALWSDLKSGLAPGFHSFTWDGQSTSGYLPDGAYAVVLEATASGFVDLYDPPANVGSGAGFILGDTGLGVPITGTLSFNPFENTPLTATYSLAQNPDRHRPFSARVTVEIHQRTDSEDDCDPNDPPVDGPVVAEPWTSKPIWVGDHTFLWDGLVDATGALDSGIPEGTVLADSGVAGGGFCASFGIPRALKPNHVIVDGVQPTITGPNAAPAVQVLADPFVVDPTYEQVSELEFRVDQDSDEVTVYILPPLLTDITNCDVADPAPCLSVSKIAGTVAAGVPTFFQWRAHSESDSNDLETSVTGQYTYVIEATSVATDLKSVYRGVIQVSGM